MSGFLDGDLHSRDEAARALYAVSEAAHRSADALAQLKAAVDRITEHYRDGGAGTEGGSPK